MKTSILGMISGNLARYVALDKSSRALLTVGYAHGETHGGNRFYVMYSVASLGAMETPDDTITLTWTTPNTTKWGHFTFWATGTGGWRLRLIEAPTGGAASATGLLSILNHQRNSAKVSKFAALDSAVGKVSYDATIATGGVSLWDEYIPGGSKSGGSAGADRDEIILKQNTKYQLSLFGGDADPATIYIDWYEHTDKD